LVFGFGVFSLDGAHPPDDAFDFDAFGLDFFGLDGAQGGHFADDFGFNAFGFDLFGLDGAQELDDAFGFDAFGFALGLDLDALGGHFAFGFGFGLGLHLLDFILRIGFALDPFCLASSDSQELGPKNHLFLPISGGATRFASFKPLRRTVLMLVLRSARPSLIKYF